jgi:hypothetical protein
MAPPTFFDTSFRRISVAAIADVQTIIDSIKDEVLVQLPLASRWTNLGSDKLQTPPDSSGRFMSVQLTRISATRIAFHVRNQRDQTILDGRADIAGVVSCKIWSGDYHLLFEESSGGEKGYAALLDVRPEEAYNNPFFVFAKTQRDSAGVLFPNAASPRHWFAQDASFTVAEEWRGCDFTRITEFKTMSGVDLAIGVPGMVITDLASRRRGGILYQLAWVEGTQAAGATVAIPVDTGVTANFEVLGTSVTGNGQRMAVRRT